TGRLLHTLPFAGIGPFGLAFTVDGKSLLVGARQALIRVEVATGREAGSYPLNEQGNNVFGNAVVHAGADGKMMHGIGGYNMRSKGGQSQWALLAWDVGSGKRLLEAPLESETIW